MLPVLRPHQEQDLNALRAETRAGRNPVLVAPCGYGKGTLISVIVHNAVHKKHHVIFAVHGKSLVVDMSDRITKLGIEHGVLMGGEKRQRWHPVQVASIDTLHRMAHPPLASLIIVDEAHTSLSPTWRKTLERYPAARVIGATATPIRLDGKGLGKATGGLFDSMVLGPSEEELIALGHLVRSRVLAPPPPADIGTVKKTAGEFNQKQLATVCDKTKLIGDIVQHWKKHGRDKKTNAFGVDQAHAKHICEQFNEAGIPWGYIDANTSLEERAAIYKDFDAPTGTLMGIASVGCQAVGWDHPICSCLIGARPTQSLGLWRQMLGRGSRPSPGKDHFLVLDHSGNTHRHDPFGMFEDQVQWSLDGAAIKAGPAADKPIPVATCKHSYRWPDGRHEPPKIVNGVQLPCYATFRAGPKECPFCGLLLRVVARKIEVEEGELSEITRPGSQAERIEAARLAREQKSEYYKLLAVAKKRGLREGWVYKVFCNKFGFAPPAEWRGHV